MELVEGPTLQDRIEKGALPVDEALGIAMQIAEALEAAHGPELGASVFVIPGESTKNGEERVVVLNRVARRVVEAQRGGHPERVFTYKGRPVGRMLNTAWKKARQRVGLPRVRVHDLRHTFGHRLRAAGVRNEDRKALMGHTTGDATTHYSAPELTQMLEFVERLTDQTRATVLRAVSEK